jgi:hypothetical protein
MGKLKGIKEKNIEAIMLVRFIVSNGSESCQIVQYSHYQNYSLIFKAV